MGVKNKSPQDALLRYVDYFELKTILTSDSRETSAFHPNLTTKKNLNQGPYIIRDYM